MTKIIKILYLLISIIITVHIIGCAAVAAENTESITVAVEYSWSNLYELELQKIEGPFGDRDGAIAVLGTDILVATKSGDLYILDEARVLFKLPYKIPTNLEDFRLPAYDESKSSFGIDAFGVKDIFVRHRGNLLDLYASYHHWNVTEECATLSLSVASFQYDEFIRGVAMVDWRTMYASHPCLELKQEGHSFAGHQAGGRLWVNLDGSIFLTIGDYEHDGLHGENFPQDLSTSYGKVIKIDAESLEAKVFTLGHRNPQGLYVSPGGEIWSTEHGPAGGDELNLLVQKGNYGWPYVTYGIDYELPIWPLSERQGSHEGYLQPVFAWVPSIGISNLIGVERRLFDLWHGDLIVASLVRETLYRVRIRERRVVLAEPIEIGHRIRDLVEAEDGTIVMKTDDELLIFMRPKSIDQRGDEDGKEKVGADELETSP